jgi:hypothetical protein
MSFLIFKIPPTGRGRFVTILKSGFKFQLDLLFNQKIKREIKIFLDGDLKPE